MHEIISELIFNVWLPGFCLVPEIFVWQGYVEQRNVIAPAQVFVSRMLFGLTMVKILILMFTFIHLWQGKNTIGNSPKKLFTFGSSVSILRIIIHDIPCMMFIHLFVVKPSFRLISKIFGLHRAIESHTSKPNQEPIKRRASLSPLPLEQGVKTECQFESPITSVSVRYLLFCIGNAICYCGAFFSLSKLAKCVGAGRDIKTAFRVATLFYILVGVFLLIIIGHILHLEQARNQFYNVRDYSLMQVNVLEDHASPSDVCFHYNISLCKADDVCFERTENPLGRACLAIVDLCAFGVVVFIYVVSVYLLYLALPTYCQPRVILRRLETSLLNDELSHLNS